MNNMENQPILSFQHPSLSMLDLSMNHISDWKMLQTLASVESLHSLLLYSNPLITSSLTFDFPYIHCLDINSIEIENRDQLEALLSHFPSLIELEIRKNPFYSQSPSVREVYFVFSFSLGTYCIIPSVKETQLYCYFRH